MNRFDSGFLQVGNSPTVNHEFEIHWRLENFRTCTSTSRFSQIFYGWWNVELIHCSYCKLRRYTTDILQCRSSSQICPAWGQTSQHQASSSQIWKTYRLLRWHGFTKVGWSFTISKSFMCLQVHDLLEKYKLEAFPWICHMGCNCIYRLFRNIQ